MGFVHILEGWALGFATVSPYCITAVHNGCNTFVVKTVNQLGVHSLPRLKQLHADAIQQTFASFDPSYSLSSYMQTAYWKLGVRHSPYALPPLSCTAREWSINNI